ncbi:hypothetical protein D3C73_1443950 [compost metagenome]
MPLLAASTLSPPSIRTSFPIGEYIRRDAIQANETATRRVIKLTTIINFEMESSGVVMERIGAADMYPH